MIPRDPLVQGEALGCTMPIWCGGSFERFPKGPGPFPMEAFVHALQDVPRQSAGRECLADTRAACRTRESAKQA